MQRFSDEKKHTFNYNFKLNTILSAIHQMKEKEKEREQKYAYEMHHLCGKIMQMNW